jgi:hypothetical protein
LRGIGAARKLIVFVDNLASPSDAQPVLLYTQTASNHIPILLHIQYTIDSESEVRPSMLCVNTCQSVVLVLRSRHGPSVRSTNPLQTQPFQPVCLRIWSAFSFLGSGSKVRFLWASSRRSRAICLDCLVVGRRMAQFIWPKMLVLMATIISQDGSQSANQSKAYHPHNMGTVHAPASPSHTPSTCSAM